VYTIAYLKDRQASSAGDSNGATAGTLGASGSLVSVELAAAAESGSAPAGETSIGEADIAGEEKNVPCARIRCFRVGERVAPMFLALSNPAPAPAPAPRGPEPTPLYRVGQAVEARYSGGLEYRAGLVIDCRPVYDSRSNPASASSSSSSDRVATGFLYDVRYDGPGSLRDRGVPESDIRLPSASTAGAVLAASGGGGAVAPSTGSVAAASDAAAIAAGDAVELRDDSAGGSSSWRRGTCVRAAVVRSADGPGRGVVTLYDVVLDAGGKVTGVARERLRLVADDEEVVPVPARASQAAPAPLIAPALSKTSDSPRETAASATAVVAAGFAAPFSGALPSPAATTPSGGSASAAAPSVTTTAADAAPAANRSTTEKAGTDSAAAAAQASAPTVATDPAELRGRDQTGLVLAVGDRIEAKYRGKGTRYWPGRVSAVRTASDGSGAVVMSIRYDDGDKEEGARSESIRRVGASSVPDSAAEPAAATQASGSGNLDGAQSSTAVAAAAPTAATVSTASSADSAANAAPTEQSDKPIATAPAELRGQDQAGLVLVAGDRIEALYRGKGKRMYPGVITALKAASDGSGAVLASIRYDDGDREDGARSEHMRRVGASKADSAPASAPAGNSGSDLGSGSAAGSVASPPPAEVTAGASSMIVSAAATAEASLKLSDGASAAATSTTSSAAPSATASILQGKDQNGVLIAVGDKVEARFMRRARYFPGRITALKPAGSGASDRPDVVLVTVKYDDGDKDDDLPSDFVRRVSPRSDRGAESPTSSSSARPTELRGRDEAGRPLAVGDRVQARYRGKSTRWYGGRVTRLTQDRVDEDVVLIDIRYDDGDDEHGARSENVRRVGESLSGPDAGTTGAAARPTDSGSAVSGGSGAVASADNSSGVAEGPGAVKAAAPASAVASAPASSLGQQLTNEKPTSAAPAELRGQDQAGLVLVVGDRIEALYRGKGKRMYPGVITALKASADGSSTLMSILYDDGDKEEGARSEHVKRVGPSKADSSPSATASAAAKPSELAVSTEAASAPVQTATAAGPASPSAAAQAATSAATSSAVPAVTASQAGQPSTSNTASSAVMAAPAELRGQDQAGLLLVIGDRIEALYRGKGRRMYPGIITALKAVPGSSDVTFSLLYDDGDKEEGARGEHIRRVGGTKGEVPATDVAVAAAKSVPAAASAALPADAPAAAQPAPSTTAVSSTAAPAELRGQDQAGLPLAVGDRIEALFRGKGKRMYPGVITGFKAASDGSGAVLASIRYDDGDREDGARSEHMRRIPSSDAPGGGINTSIASAAAPVATVPSGTDVTVALASSDTAVPSRVEAAAATLGQANAKRPSSAVERPAAHGASEDQAPAAVDQAGKPVAKGDRVEARYRGRGTRYYPGKVSEVVIGALGGVSFNIAYDDGDRETGAKPENIRLLAGLSPTAGAIFRGGLGGTGGSGSGAGLGDTLNSTFGSVGSKAMRVSFSDQHDLDLERSKDNEPRYAPSRRAAGGAYLRGVPEDPEEAAAVPSPRAARAAGAVGPRPAAEATEGASSSGDAGAGHYDESFESLSGSLTLGDTSRSGSGHLASTFKPLPVASAGGSGASGIASSAPAGAASASAAAAAADAPLAAGARVECLDLQTMAWRPGKILRVAADGGVSVAYEGDGGFDFGLPPHRVRRA
jgi:hypothetical protein